MANPIINRPAEEDNALPKQARIDVISPLPELALLNNGWNQICHMCAQINLKSGANQDSDRIRRVMRLFYKTKNW